MFEMIFWILFPLILLNRLRKFALGCSIIICHCYCVGWVNSKLLYQLCSKEIQGANRESLQSRYANNISWRILFGWSHIPTKTNKPTQRVNATKRPALLATGNLKGMRKVTFKAMRWSHVNGTLATGFGVGFWDFVFFPKNDIRSKKSPWSVWSSLIFKRY